MINSFSVSVSFSLYTRLRRPLVPARPFGIQRSMRSATRRLHNQTSLLQVFHTLSSDCAGRSTAYCAKCGCMQCTLIASRFVPPLVPSVPIDSRPQPCALEGVWTFICCTFPVRIPDLQRNCARSEAKYLAFNLRHRYLRSRRWIPKGMVLD